MRRVVYTVITSPDYHLREHKTRSKGWEKICFTTMNLSSETWSIRKIEPEGDPRKLSRKVKIKFFDYMDADEVWYFDTRFTIKHSLNALTERRVNDDTELAAMKHNKRCNVYQELSYLLKIGVGDPEKIRSQLRDYQDAQFQTQGLYAPGIMFRRDTPAVRKLMTAWYEEVEKYTYRDIPCLPFALDKHPVRFQTLPWKIYNTYMEKR